MNSIVAVRGVSFELSNGRELFNNLNFSLARKLIALVGPNGVGKIANGVNAGCWRRVIGFQAPEARISESPQRRALVVCSAAHVE